MKNITTIDRYLTKNTSNKISNFSYLIAVSGGIDSMFLFQCMFELSKKYNFKIGVAHYNYNTTSSSIASLKLCKKIISQYGIPLYIRSSKIASKNNFEHKARVLRYDFFKNIIKHDKYDFVVTGHNYNDLIETLYMQNDKDDYSLIPFSDKKILRPMLSIRRNEIEKDIDKHKIDFIYDLTNNNNQLKRNRVRNVILPKILKNDNYHKTLLSNYDIKIDRHNLFITKKNLINYKYVDFNKTNNILSINALIAKSYDLYAFKMIIQGQIKKHYSIHIVKSKKFWTQLYTSMNNNLKINKLYLSDNLDIYLTDSILMISPSNHLELCKKLSNGVEWLNSKFSISNYSADKHPASDKSFLILPKYQFNEGMYVRRWHHGDKIKLKNLGSIKVSDLFNSNNIPTLLRKKIPIIEANRRIVWVPHIAIAENSLIGDDLVKISHKDIQ